MAAIGDDPDRDLAGDGVIETATGGAAADVELARAEYGYHLCSAVELFGLERYALLLKIALVHRDVKGSFGDRAVHARPHGFEGLRRARSGGRWLRRRRSGWRWSGRRARARRGHEREKRHDDGEYPRQVAEPHDA